MADVSIKQKILIIENEINVLYGLQAKFSMKGYLVDVHQGTGTIEEAINFIHIAKPNLVILDLNLPEVDGMELLATIRGNIELSHLPVFIFTNTKDRQTRDRTKRLGVEQYFVKSEFTLDEFVDKVIKIRKNQRQLKHKK